MLIRSRIYNVAHVLIGQGINLARRVSNAPHPEQ